ncbi:MAG: co-chaperone YbbN, partial [Mesorhizobium sp.]
MSDNNPYSGAFGGNGGQYAQTVQYGGGDRPKVSLGETPAAADLIKDTTTATFAAD